MLLLLSLSHSLSRAGSFVAVCNFEYAKSRSVPNTSFDWVGTVMNLAYSLSLCLCRAALFSSTRARSSSVLRLKSSSFHSVRSSGYCSCSSSLSRLRLKTLKYL